MFIVCAGSFELRDASAQVAGWDPAGLSGTTSSVTMQCTGRRFGPPPASTPRDVTTSFVARVVIARALPAGVVQPPPGPFDVMLPSLSPDFAAFALAVRGASSALAQGFPTMVTKTVPAFNASPQATQPNTLRATITIARSSPSRATITFDVSPGGPGGTEITHCSGVIDPAAPAPAPTIAPPPPPPPTAPVPATLPLFTAGVFHDRTTELDLSCKIFATPGVAAPQALRVAVDHRTAGFGTPVPTPVRVRVLGALPPAFDDVKAAWSTLANDPAVAPGRTHTVTVSPANGGTMVLGETTSTSPGSVNASAEVDFLSVSQLRVDLEYSSIPADGHGVSKAYCVGTVRLDKPFCTPHAESVAWAQIGGGWAVPLTAQTIAVSGLIPGGPQALDVALLAARRNTETWSVPPAYGLRAAGSIFFKLAGSWNVVPNDRAGNVDVVAPAWMLAEECGTVWNFAVPPSSMRCEPPQTGPVLSQSGGSWTFKNDAAVITPTFAGATPEFLRTRTRDALAVAPHFDPPGAQRSSPQALVVTSDGVFTRGWLQGTYGFIPRPETLGDYPKAIAVPAALRCP